MHTVGDYLKQSREARNISLSDVAEYTKISKLYLNCLENNEFKKIPAKAYVKGYIASYAACLGIDRQDALRLYDSFQDETTEAEESTSEILRSKKNAVSRFFRLNKKTGLVLAAGIVITLSIGIYYSFFQNPKKTGANIDNRLEVQHNALNPAPISTIAHDLPPKKQNKNSFESQKQSGPPKTIATTEIRIEPYDDMSQLSGLPEIQRPKQNPTEALSEPPVNEPSPANELSASQNVPIPYENHLKIIEAAACSNIKDRIPQGSGNSFEWSMDKIFIWTRIQCDRLPSSIRHIYYFKGEKVNDISLNVRSSHWRTWSYKTISNKRYIGPWRVEIASNDGKLLQTINFEIN